MSRQFHEIFYFQDKDIISPFYIVPDPWIIQQTQFSKSERKAKKKIRWINYATVTVLQ